MNERILELAREAELLVHNPTGVPTKLEKFAQLIVKECLVMTKGYEFALGRKDELSKTMREHFGVEL
jgi:hypothetical protein